MSADAPLSLEGFTRVFSGAKHEVFCNGRDRLWVYRQTPDRTRATHVWRCPECRCSAFALPNGANR